MTELIIYKRAKFLFKITECTMASLDYREGDSNGDSIVLDTDCDDTSNEHCYPKEELIFNNGKGK